MIKKQRKSSGRPYPGPAFPPGDNGAKRRMKKARVTVEVFHKNGFTPLVTKEETTMSTDLPAENLGEIVCDAVQKAWKAGHDPVDFKLIVSFS